MPLRFRGLGKLRFIGFIDRIYMLQVLSSRSIRSGLLRQLHPLSLCLSLARINTSDTRRSSRPTLLPTACSSLPMAAVRDGLGLGHRCSGWSWTRSPSMGAIFIRSSPGISKWPCFFFAHFSPRKGGENRRRRACIWSARPR